jgi:predicted anti-sigma-YlaC factor YlaD
VRQVGTGELCRKVEEELLPAIGEVIPEPEWVDHLLACPECRGRLAEMSRMLKVLSSLGDEVVAPPATLLGDVLSVLQRAAQHKALTSFFSGERLGYVAAGLVGIVAGGLAGLVATLRLRRRALLSMILR